MRFRLKIFLIVIALAPAVLWLLTDMWDRRRGVDIELHFQDEVEDNFQVVFEVDKAHGSNFERIGMSTYRMEVPNSHHVRLASNSVLKHWHRVFVVTPRHKERRLAFQSPESYTRAGRTPLRRTPDGKVVSRSTLEGTRHVWFVKLAK
jgi:hypothetical protein